MLVARTAPLRSTMSARWAWIGSPASAAARLRPAPPPTSSAMRPATVEKPRMKTTPSSSSRVSALTRSARCRAREPRGALLGLDEVRVLAFGAGR